MCKVLSGRHCTFKVFTENQEYYSVAFVGSAGMRYFWSRYEIFLHTFPATGVALNAARYIIRTDSKLNAKR